MNEPVSENPALQPPSPINISLFRGTSLPMSPLFVIALITALVSAYLYLNLSEEVPRMCALGIVALSFVLDLILAPWPIQLAILTLVLIVPRKLIAPN